MGGGRGIIVLLLFSMAHLRGVEKVDGRLSVMEVTLVSWDSRECGLASDIVSNQ
jgi:hypothetical protein